jgi:hypothetical protein
LVVGLSVIAVLIVRVVAIAVIHPDPRFEPLGWGPPILDTVLCATAAVVVFAKVGESMKRPVRAYRRIAAAVLVLSFWPDVELVMGHGRGATWPAAFALMTMHVVVWALCVTLLPGLTKGKSG